MRSWRPTSFLQASIALHAAALVWVALRPSAWTWALAVVVLDHIAITIAGLWPRSTLLGPNIVRLPPAARARGEVAITIDDGPDPEVTPRVLQLLERAGAKATFFCIGERAERNAQLCREIIAAGHAIENHGQRHRNHISLLGYRSWLREVGDAQRTLTALTGQAPRYFRALAGLRNPFLEPALARLGIELASWTRRGFDTRIADPERVYARLATNLAAGDIVLLHDGHSARTMSGQPVILEVLPRLLQEFTARGLVPVTLASACRRN